MCKFNSFLKEARSIKDTAGTPIDEGIIELVAALQMYGFRTTGSCEGHYEYSGMLYPFVTIASREPEGYDYDLYLAGDDSQEKLHEQWLQSNYSEQRRLFMLLEEFYKENPPKMVKSTLIVKSFGPGIGNLQTAGAEVMHLEKDLKQVLTDYQQQMKAFYLFLIKNSEA